MPAQTKITKTAPCWVTDAGYRNYLEGISDEDMADMPAHTQQDYLDYTEDMHFGEQCLSEQRAEHQNDLIVEYGHGFRSDGVNVLHCGD